MNKKYLYALGMAAVASTAMTGSIQAKKNIDWIETVSIEKDGIDVTPVEVVPTKNRYSKVRTSSHRFSLGGYVKAKKRKKIARVTWQSKKNPIFHKGGKPSWEKRGLIRLGLRETPVEYNKAIPLSRITWINSPVAACEKLKVAKMADGMSQKAIFSKQWSTKATAAFYVKADVIRKNAKLKDNNYDSETAMMSYPVNVHCLAAPKMAKQNTSTKKGSRPPARAPRVPIK